LSASEIAVGDFEAPTADLTQIVYNSLDIPTGCSTFFSPGDTSQQQNETLQITIDAHSGTWRLCTDTGSSVTLGYDASSADIESAFATLGDTVVVPVSDPAEGYTGHIYTVLFNNGAPSHTYLIDTNNLQMNAGGGTYYTYDNHGNKTSETDLLGNTTAYTYDSADRITDITAPNGTITNYVYDTEGNQSSVTNAYNTTLASTTSYTYDAFGHQTSKTDADGHKILYEYDGDGNLIQETDGLVVDQNNYVISNSAETRTYYTYDGAGHQTSVTTAYGTTLAATNYYTYDAAGNQTSMTDPLGHATLYRYDSSGNQIQATQINVGLDAAGDQLYPDRVTTSIYDPVTGNLNSTTIAASGTIHSTVPIGNSLQTSYTYDPFGRTSSITQPSGGVTQTTYDAAGNVRTTTDSQGNVTTNTYTNGRLTQVTLVTPDIYDGDINLIDASKTLVTQYQYDLSGNVTQITDPLGRVIRYTYDLLNRETSVTKYDTSGDLISTTSTTYDYAGNVIDQTDVLGDITHNTYDLLGRLTDVKIEDSTHNVISETSYTYDAVGNQTSSTDALGHTTTYRYDALNRQIAVIGPAPTGTGTVTLSASSYDAAGNVNSITDSAGRTTNNVYDVANRLVSSTGPAGTTTYQYDEFGQLIRTVSPAANGQSTVVTTNSYDSMGNMLSTTIDDGISQKTTSFTYDTAGRQSSSTIAAGTSAAATTYFTYDSTGNRTSLTDPEGNLTTWVYNSFNQPIIETVQGCAINGISPAPNISTFKYDADGQLIEKIDADGRATTYSYDAQGHLLTEKWHADSNPPGASIGGITYSYDANGNLLEALEVKVVDGATSTVTDDTFTYNSMNEQTTETIDVPGYAPVVILTNGYNAVGQQNSLLTTIGGTVDLANAYTYDNQGQLTQITQSSQAGGNAVAYKRVNIGYNANGQRTSLSRTASSPLTFTIRSTALQALLIRMPKAVHWLVTV
jgi:YD repeat-containing protein